MVTIEELRAENERLRKMQSKLKEIQKNNNDRTKLLRENKILARNIKHGKKIGIAKDIGRGFAKVGKRTGREVLRAGKGAFKGLQRYANFLAEQEAKQRRLNRNLRTTKKTIKRKQTRRRRK